MLHLRHNNTLQKDTNVIDKIITKLIPMYEAL